MQDQFTEYAFYQPWVDGMARINPRDRLSIDMTFEYTAQNDAQQNRRINDALYFVRILRNWLLTNADAHRIGYQGIRVRQFLIGQDAYSSRYGLRIESDDEWVGGARAGFVHHLQRPEQLQIREGARAPDLAFMAQDRPPAPVPAPQAPPPPAPSRRVPRVRSALDESDDEDA